MRKIFTFLLALAASVGMSWAATTDLASITGNYTAQDGEILTGTLGVNVKISIADGAKVTLLNANINGDKTWTTGEYAGLTCLGNATITIVGKNYVSGFYADDLGNGYSGIYVPSGKTLIINGTGSLTAQSSTEEAAGIGARKNLSCGNIVIQSGKITAIASGEYGAGIGGAYNASCGDITISGGIVTAVGGDHCAGIGGGRRGANTNAGHCGNIEISGGVVSATSGEQAAAIGGGRGNNNNYKTNCGTITITNTALKVYADQGGSSTNTIGAAKYGNCGAVTIGGSTGVINTDPYTYRTKEDGEIVVDYINAIGTVVYTQECKDKIDIARELYDALEASQKTLVTNYQKLLDAEAAYAALIPQPVLVTANTLQLHVNNAAMGSVALQNPSSDIIDNGDGTYTVPEGAEVTILATPNEGYEFTGWKASSSICDFADCEFTALPTVENPLTFDMYQEVAIMAEFAAVASQPEPQPAGNVVIWNMSMDAVNGIVEQNETKEVFGGITIAVGVKRAFMMNGNVNALLFAFSANTQEGFKGFTFANTLGVNFKKIVLSGAADAFNGKESTGWVINEDKSTITWEGDAASVSIWETLNFIGPIIVNEVEFTLEGGAPTSAEDVNITPSVDPKDTGVYYSTFYDSANKYALPAGVEAYVAEVSSNALNLTKIAGEGQTIPKDNAVILKSTVDQFTLTLSDAAPVSFTATNSLKGVDADTEIATVVTGTCYVLSGNSTDGVGFFGYQAPNQLKAHKAYIDLNVGGMTPAPRRMPFVFNGEQTATGIDNASDKFGGSEKVLRDGQLIIIRNGIEYNANGQIVK